CRAQILVDHCLDTAQLVAVIEGRDAAASCADDHAAFLQQPLDRTDLEDTLWPWAGHHTAELVAVRSDAPAALGGQAIGLLPRIDRADRLARVAEGRVVAIDLDLSQEGGEGHLERQQVAQ